MIAFTQQLAIQNAEYGIRANAILPGLMDTPMAVDTRARVSGKSRAEVVAARNARVPLRGRMGTAWDVANAALFLASDEANFITGAALPGQRRSTRQYRVRSAPPGAGRGSFGCALKMPLVPTLANSSVTPSPALPLQGEGCEDIEATPPIPSPAG